MHNLLFIVLAVMATLLASCSARGVYEGLQQQESANDPPPSGQPAQRKPSYDEYEAERRRQSVPPSSGY